MGFLDSFTARNVLRASGIAALVPGIPLIVVPAAVIAQIFGKSLSPGKDTKEEFLGRSLGVAETASAVMALACPGRDMLHIRIAQGIGHTVLSGKRAQECDEKGDGDKAVTKFLFGVDVAFLIALLIAKKNDDDVSGKAWHKIMP
jgi:hypothetical protein